ADAGWARQPADRHDDWCSCGECRPVKHDAALEDEDLCCAEVAAVSPLRGNSCITRHELFPLLCLRRDLLEIHARHVRYYTPTYLERSDSNR
ncbi:unnamed protein product, partial [Ixodes pacificus]